MTPQEVIEHLEHRMQIGTASPMWVLVDPIMLQSAIDIIRHQLHQQPEPDAMRVRVAVAVDSKGFIAVCAIDPECDEREAMYLVKGGEINCNFDPYEITHECFVVADIPRIPTVAGRVESEPPS